MTMGTTAAAFEMDIPTGGAMFPIAGAPIPGQSATYQQIFAMVYSIVQARRVAQNAVAAATPGF